MLAALVCLACGEVERFDVAVRPRLDDFESHVRPMLLEVGCSRNGRCHTQLVGDVQLTDALDAAQVQAEYEGLKAVVDLDAPGQGKALTLLLKGHPAPTHRPAYCFESVNSCAYRKLLAWVAWAEADDLRPGQVACDYSDEACP